MENRDLYKLKSFTLSQLFSHFLFLDQPIFQPMQVGWKVSQSLMGIPAECGGYHPASRTGGYKEIVLNGNRDLTEGCWVSLGGGSIYSHARVAYVGRRYAPQQPAVLSDGRCSRDPATPLAIYTLGEDFFPPLAFLQEELEGATMPLYGGMYDTYSGHKELSVLHAEIRDAELAGCLDAPL